MSVQSVDFKDWRLWVIVAGGALAIGGVAYWLLRDESASEKDQENALKRKKKISPHNASVDDVHCLLKELNRCQTQVKAAMKSIMDELRTKEYSFDEVYELVAERQPQDALEENDLSMEEFDSMLEKYKDDHRIQEQVSQIMGSLPPLIKSGSEIPPKVQALDRDTILSVHSFMLEELDKLVLVYKNLPNRSKYKIRNVTVAAQAIVGSKVEKKFGLESDDMEAAVWLNQSELTHDAEFAKINLQMQSRMHVFMTEYGK